MVGDYLPKDVLVEVLARLPVKSVLRFKCVSKSWRDILKDPSFITKHYLTRATSNNGSTVLTKRYRPIKTYSDIDCLFYSPLFSDLALMSDDAQAIEFTSLNPPFFKEEQEIGLSLDVAGPINGIIVVYIGNDPLYLWNPATKKYRALPCSSTPSQLPSNYNRPECHCVVGFGIDPNTNGYKVVKIWNILDWDTRASMSKVELLSLSADSCKPCSSMWQIIDAIPPVYPQYYKQAVYLKGKYYWYTHVDFYHGSVDIVWFDMGTELFGLIESPSVHCSGGRYFYQLMIMKDSVAMIEYTHQVDEIFFFKISIMNECDAKVSWTYYATVGPFVDYHNILGLWKGDELVVEINGVLVMIRIPSGELISYVMKKPETVDRSLLSYAMENYGVPFIDDISKRMRLNPYLSLVNYNESLVSVMDED